MKYIFIFLLAVTIAYSQNTEPSQKKFYLNGDSVYLSGDLDYFKLKKFILGYHWGDEKTISKNLLNNQKDASSNMASSLIGDSLLLFIRSYWNDPATGYHYELNTHTEFDYTPAFGKSLVYDPSLTVNPSNPYELNVHVGDHQNPIFGFMKKRGRTLTNQADVNYSRLIIDSTSLIDSVVLAEPWPSKMMYYTFDHPSVEDTAKKRLVREEYSGQRFYISINLRRFDNNLQTDDTPVLSIKVPYKFVSVPNPLTYSLAYAKFDSIPKDNTAGDNDTLPRYNSSILRKLQEFSGSKPNEIIITRKMLPLNNKDITISGFMIFDGLTEPPFNRNQTIRSMQDPQGIGNENDIDSLKIEVKYLGGCQVAIDWVKFETVNARRINCGNYDTLFQKGIQQDLTYYTQSAFSSRGVKPYRFIYNIEGSVVNWEAERHFKKLIGDIVTGQSAPFLPKHYDHYVNPADKWYSYFKFTPMVATPFSASNKQPEENVVRNGITYVNKNTWKTLGFYQGYVKHPLDSFFNIFNSGYDTYLRSGLNASHMRSASMSTYLDNSNVIYTQGRTSPMVYWEYFIYKKQIEGMFEGYEFSDKSWFPQSFLQSFFQFEEVHNTVDSVPDISLLNTGQAHNCNITGEQYRLMNWGPLILGCKGLMYDGGFDYPNQVKILPPRNGNRCETPRLRYFRPNNISQTSAA